MELYTSKPIVREHIFSPDEIKEVLRLEKEALEDIEETRRRAIANVSEHGRKSKAEIGSDTRDFDWRYLSINDIVGDEKGIIKGIDDAIKKYKDTFKTEINFHYDYNFTILPAIPAQGSHPARTEKRVLSLKIKDVRFTCLLRGLNPDGSERCTYQDDSEKPVNDLSDLELSTENIELSLGNLDDIENLILGTESKKIPSIDDYLSHFSSGKKQDTQQKINWADSKTPEELENEARAKCKRTDLPPIFKVPSIKMTKVEYDKLISNKKEYLINEDYTFNIKFSRSYVDSFKSNYSNKVSNVLFVFVPRYTNLREEEVKECCKRFASDPETPLVMKMDGCSTPGTFPFIKRVGNTSSFYMIFDPNTRDGKFAVKFSNTIYVDEVRCTISLCFEDKCDVKGAIFEKEEIHKAYKETIKSHNNHSYGYNNNNANRGGHNNNSNRGGYTNTVQRSKSDIVSGRGGFSRRGGVDRHEHMRKTY
jgi:hypothetical protein